MKSARGGYVASSYKKLGPFVLKGGQKVKTSPAYPKAFFKKSATPVYLRSTGAQHPVETAFRMSKDAIAANLTGEMRKALENGLKILEDQTRRAAQMNDLAKHL
jgi:hypothetical protein